MGRGRLRPVDLQVLASALAGDVLFSLCQCLDLFGISRFGPLGDDCNRIRVEAAALVQLYRLLVAELATLAPGLPPDRVFSTGSLWSWSLERARVRPLAEKAAGIAPYYLGEMASAFYGGRIEALMVGILVSMALADISKTYASMLSIGGIGRFYGADHFGIDPVDARELHRWLRSRAWRHQRAAWAEMSTVFAQTPPRGELALPSHPEWGPDAEGLTVAPLHLFGGWRTFHVWDLAAGIEEGADPAAIEIGDSWRLVARGRQPGLRRIRLLSGRSIDLWKDDLGAALIDDCGWAESQPDRPWLPGLAKRYAQVAPFGGLARHDRRSLDEPVDHVGYGPGGVLLRRSTHHPEPPGPYAFLPLAAAVCAGARLAMAMAHRQVRGG